MPIFKGKVILPSTSTAPASAVEGQAYVDSDDKVLYLYDGTAWDAYASQDYVDARFPSGSVIQYGGSSAPTGFVLCDGTAYSRTTYAALFAAIGTSYGTGDGSTTFNVPNLKGKVPVGRDSADTNFDTLGETGGASSVTLTGAQSGIAQHNHNLNSSTGSATLTGSQPTFTYNRFTNTSDVNGTRARITDITTTGSNNTLTTTGGGAKLSGSTENASATNASQAHTNLQPYIVLNYIIKV